MSIEVGDIVRYKNVYLKLFGKRSKRAKRYLRLKNQLFVVHKIHAEADFYCRKTKKHVFARTVVLRQGNDVSDKWISYHWLSVVRKAKRVSSYPRGKTTDHPESDYGTLTCPQDGLSRLGPAALVG